MLVSSSFKMKLFIAVALSLPLAATLTTAAPTPTKTLQRRADFCGQWDSTVTGSYTVYNNLWGEGSASSGSQCTGVDSLDGNTLAWHTSWTWEGGSSSVKSFANAAYAFTATQLSQISSIPTTWQWRYDNHFFCLHLIKLLTRM